MNKYQKIINRKSTENIRTAYQRILTEHHLLNQIFQTGSSIRIAQQNSVLLEFDEENDQMIATYNGRIFYRGHGDELYNEVIKEIKRRMLRKEIDPKAKIYTKTPKGILIDTTKELKYA